MIAVLKENLPQEEMLDKSMIAALPALAIQRMDCDELVRLIEATDLPMIRGERSRHLMNMDRNALLRLAYLARRCCRNQGY
jgi:hypothetical protein